MITWLLLLVAATGTIAAPFTQWQSNNFWKVKLEQYWLNPTEPANKMVLPMYDDDPSERIRDIEKKQLGYLYGPSLLGNSSYFPAGPLGDTMVQQHQDQWYSEAAWLVESVFNETKLVATALAKVIVMCGLCIMTIANHGIGRWSKKFS